jgi:hypothetical protein
MDVAVQVIASRQRLSMEQRAQARCGILLHRWQGMGIRSECHLDSLVTQPVLNDARGNASLQHQRGGRVPESMNRDPPDPS